MTQEIVQDLFGEIAGGLPGAVAVDTGRRRITYGELESRSNRIANLLLAGGMVKSSLVAILAQDPGEVIASMLGILKAGGVFVPMDPSFPPQRLEVMARQVEPKWYVAESRFADRLEGMRDGEVRVIPLDGEELKQADAGRPAVESSPDDPCSIYFTSGSTGRPKAILGRLKGIAHFALWEAGVLGVGRGTRVSQLASPSFDGFLKDAFVPLCAGGVVCAPESRDVLLEPSRLIDWVDVEGVEVLHCVPSVLRSILNEKLDAKYFGDLKWVVLAGEALLPADVRRWRETFGDRVRLVNLYGPTETTVTKLYHVVEPADVERPSIPIGKPMPGAAALILNAGRSPAGQESVGEIYLRTPYRALGYYGEPELTREAFVPNPFSDDPKDLIYRTGDFGRLLREGSLEFLGRRDHQVKIRGVRVELGEIENLLRLHSGVKDVAVVDRDGADGTKYLCAYLVLVNGTAAGELREHLLSQLPEFMVPSAFVEMAELPRTLNGKIDRKALPALDQVQADRQDQEESRLRTAVEEIVAGIWSEVLRLPRVGLGDNFFELGGHSLLATQIISRVRESLGVELPLRVLFEAPTVAELSMRIEREAGTAEREPPEPIRPASREGDLPLSYSQQRMWLLEQLSAGSSAFNLALGMRLRGRLSVAVLERTFDEVVRRHEILRTTFPARGGVPVQVIAPASGMSLPRVDLGGLAETARETEARRIATQEAWQPFDLARGPLVRTLLLRLGEEEHVIVCTMHHLVGDAWSFDVLAAELSRLYESFGRGEPSSLPELPIQYADYAVWQRRWLTGEVLESRLEYWRRQLEGAPSQLALPQSRPRSAVQSFRGARLPVVLPRELAAGLRSLSRREGTTLFMTLLGGFLVLLYQYTGQEDLVVGSVIANRDRSEVEKLIGFLGNTLVLRVDLSGNPSFRELLGRVRETCLGAYAYQLPPEKLTEELRGSASQRLFDVWFQMETARRERLELAGLEWERFEGERGNARFELSLVLQETPEEIRGEIEYDADRFGARTVGALAWHLRTLLEQIVAHPDGSVADVSLASQQESEELSWHFSANLES